MKTRLFLLTLTVAFALVVPFGVLANNSLLPGDAFNYYEHPDANKPLTVIPYKWPGQPLVDSWTTMEQATKEAMDIRDGYSLFQLAYLEYVHQFTHSALDPRTMLYHAFEIGKANGDPYLMYWVTDLEGVVYFNFEYLERRRNHALWTDSVASAKKEWPILYLLADLNEKSFSQMKTLANHYLKFANLKEETFGLLNFDVRKKAEEMERNYPRK
jgi:hypothetical protein